MNIGLPAGIGDFSWGWSKLYNARKYIDSIQVCDGWPHRTVPYVELCFAPDERKREISYGQFNYQSIQVFTKVNEIQNPTFAHLLREFNDHGCVLLEPNQHLELGRRLEQWMPDQPTEFHYPIYSQFAGGSALQKLKKAVGDTDIETGSLVGISCASYRGSEAWKTWGVDQWSQIFSRILGRGWTPIILGGFWDDLSHTLACKFEVPDLVGKTSVAECVEILRVLPAYIGFSSGLNVIRTVIDKPAFALWPDHQVELSRSWVPPEMLESGRYVASLWRDPEEVWDPIKGFLDLCGDEHASWEEVSREEHSTKGSKEEA